MKKYLYILPAVLTLVACSQDRLEIPQKGVVSMEEFYITDEDAESALVTTYHFAVLAVSNPNTWNIYSQYISAYNFGGDDVWAGGANFGDTDQFASQNEFRADNNNPALDAMYRRGYEAIYYANLLIDHFEYGTSDVKDRCISEARFFRAFFHMMLAMGWNNPPLVDHVLNGDEKPGNTPHDEILAFCEKEFSEIIPYLRERKNQADKNGAYIVTKAAAQAMLGRVQIYEEKWNEAKASLKKVIDSGKYDLVPGADWRSLFHPEGDGSPEKIFEFNFEADPSNPMSVYSHALGTQHIKAFNWRNDHTYIPTSLYQTGWGFGNPSAKFAEALIANDGMDSYRRKGTLKTYDEVLYEMPWSTDTKADGSLMTMEEKQKDKARGVYHASGLHGHEGYFPYKFNPDAKEVINSQYVPYNFHLVRYADVLLYYAEACAMTNDNDGLQYLQMVQKRAGSNTISQSLTMEAVKNERMFELWFEGTRFIDIVRWGDAAKELADSSKKPGQGAGYLPAFVDQLFSGESPVHKGVVVWKECTTNLNPGFKAGKHEYFPYPFAEISVNENIVQNPGW